MNVEVKNLYENGFTQRSQREDAKDAEKKISNIQHRIMNVEVEELLRCPDGTMGMRWFGFSSNKSSLRD